MDRSEIIDTFAALCDLAALPREWFRMVHLCDAPAEIPSTREGLTQIMRAERLYPGEGGIDIAGILSHLPEVPYSIELPHAQRMDHYGYEEHARRCLEAAKRYLDGPNAHPLAA